MKEQNLSKRILVTGGAGYIGSHLVDHLVEAGHQLTVLDNLATGNVRNLQHRMPDIRFINASILDEETLDREIREAEVVFHLAAAVGVRHIVDAPLEALLVNTRGTENVLAACFKHWRRVLFASTSEVYGHTAKIPMCEDDDRVLGPTTVHRWSYATAKAVDEHLALAYAAHGLPVSIVRYFNSYGPRLDSRGYGSVLANFIRQALAGEPLTVHGDGQQSRSFTYVDDTVRGTAAAGLSDAAIGQVINLGNPREITILKLAEMVRDYVGSDSPIELTTYESYYGPGFADTRRRVPDVTKAKDLLGWEPLISLEEGLERTFDWCKEQGW